MIGKVVSRCVALCVGLLAVSAVSAAPAPRALPPLSHYTAEQGAISLESGTGKVVTLTSAAANVFVADPKVAEVRPASATSLFLFGIGVGRTTVAVMDAAGGLVAQYDVTIQPSSYGAREAQAAINRLVPNSKVQVLAQSRGMLLTGSVKNPADAAQAIAIAKSFAPNAPNIENEMSIESPIQVTLSVRIAEMSRQVVRNMGVNWSALATIGSIAGTPALIAKVNGTSLVCGAANGICPGANFHGLIDALARDNLAHILAEPNLTVLSGHAASFQVGGEFPIPVSGQNNTISVDYKKYGVLLSFVPTVFADGRINLHVSPEVSELSNQNSVNVGGASAVLNIPSVTTRRAETTVELGSGQSFAIAGLLQQNTSDTGAGLPGLGDIPVLGALFRNSGFDRTEKELVIIVTPYIVKPVNTLSALRMPTDGYTPAPDIERLLLMRQVATGKTPVPIRIPGDAGFMVQ